MLQGKNAPGEFWCPTEEKREARKPGPTLEMTPSDWAALSRFCTACTNTRSKSTPCKLLRYRSFPRRWL